MGEYGKDTENKIIDQQVSCLERFIEGMGSWLWR